MPSSLLSIIPSPSHGYASDLFDRYEVQTISRLLDHYIQAANRNSAGETSDDHGRRKNSKKKPPPTPPAAKGFWLRRYAVVCGSGTADVVQTAAARIGTSSSLRWLPRR
ncbi:unnamed protein product [Cuscuta campestris]|uniref:Uncharacterized protein n=2 Tax=Cuscuta sect. Cleistogrammica TaxID=1824901 RepID=A0A484NFK9_9ASTE|nr:hypothetical protein DM860_017358 [Cuscuta australis]VFQ99693.1 unnamed protein product [Cuscuta campestris]